MKSPRRNKALETLARSVKDSDQFVAHVCNVALAYSKHHVFDATANREVRQALKVFAKHAEALSQWLHSAAGGSSSEGQALRQIAAATGNPGAIGQSVGMRAWLAQLAQTSSVVAAGGTAAAREDALRNAAEGLRATFERHGLKLSQRAPQQQQSDAVRLLCALVNLDGANELKPEQARHCFKSAKPAPTARVHKAAVLQPPSKRRNKNSSR